MDYNPFRSGRATQQTVQEAKKKTCESCGCDIENPKAQCECDVKNEAMDPVNKAELKGKHSDRKDKDINNDGKADNTDKYLHKRRKAISKAQKAEGGGKEGDVAMNPSMEKESTKESKIRSALKSVLESKDKHTAGAGPTETMKDMRKGKGAEDMMADADKEIDKGPDAHLNEPAIDKENFKKMTSNVPSKKMRKNDNPKGDTKIVPGGTQFKDPAAMKAESKDDVTPFKTESVSFAQSIRNMKAAYAEMNKPVVEEEEEINELSVDLLRKASDKAAKQAGAMGRKGNEVGASKKTDQSRKLARGATKAGDRDAEKAYQASKGN